MDVSEQKPPSDGHFRAEEAQGWTRLSASGPEMDIAEQKRPSDESFRAKETQRWPFLGRALNESDAYVVRNVQMCNSQRILGTICELRRNVQGILVCSALVSRGALLRVIKSAMRSEKRSAIRDG